MHKPHGLLAFALAAITVGCQSSAERARIEMQSVYRSAKTLDEQMKAGTELKELLKLQGNLATELAIVHDRMRVNSRLNQILANHYAAYETTLQSYSLVMDILEYHGTMERCKAPRYLPADAARQKSMSLEERAADFEATAEYFNRSIKCIEQFYHVDHSLHERADRLGMSCPSFERDSSCLTAFAEAKLMNAEKLLIGR